jgi:adenine deaminase
VDHGHIERFLRMAIDQGLDPVMAIRMATLNAAERFRLHDLGAIAPGKRADLVVFADPNDIRPALVFSGSRLVAQDNEPVGDWREPTLDETAVRNTVNVDWNTIGESTFHIPAAGDQARVIGAIEGQVTTEHRIERIARDKSLTVADVEHDILKMAVIERHRVTGNVGLGFIQGFGLQKGALAGSVAHDHHNIVTIGADDQSMLTAAQALGEMGGGFVVANQERVLAQLPLPIAGLMSDQSVNAVRNAMETLLINSAALGSAVHDPFMVMSFMALEMIPSLKLTDRGLVDVEQFKPVPLFVED